MLKKQLVKYQQLPLIPESELALLKQKIVYYDELVVDVSNFSHPGTKNVIQPWMSKNIQDIFQRKSHSFNAKLMLVNLAIGRRSQKRGQGYKIFHEIKQSKLSTIHQKVMRQIDLSFGVLKQVSKMTVEEMEAFITVPKYFTNSNQIMLTQSKWDRFWVSTTIFSLVLFMVSAYLYSNNALLNNFSRILQFGLGLFTWTAVQYYFHRIMLHVPIATGKILNGHYIHHAFPNLKNKIALSIKKNLTIQLFTYLILVYIAKVDPFSVLHFLLGLHFLMIFYDILHYYFHFGPETSIPILNALKRNHLKHHFRDSNRGFGVTTTLWDWVFKSQHVI